MKWLYLIIGLALGALAHFLYSGAASNPSGAVRTDLTIYRDAGTGCEYIRPAWSFSGLTPRNDSLGVPICSDEGVSDAVEELLDDVGNGEGTPPPAPEIAPPQAAPPSPATPPAAAPQPAPGTPPPSPSP